LNILLVLTFGRFLRVQSGMRERTSQLRLQQNGVLATACRLTTGLP